LGTTARALTDAKIDAKPAAAAAMNHPAFAPPGSNWKPNPEPRDGYRGGNGTPA
jgi:hypothetical protein